MPNTLNARIGRTRPSPALLCLAEATHAEGEQSTPRRRPADRGGLDAVKSFCNAVFHIGTQRIHRPNGTSAIGR